MYILNNVSIDRINRHLAFNKITSSCGKCHQVNSMLIIPPQETIEDCDPNTS